MNDDAAGVRVVQALVEKYNFPPDVKVMDGGTLGLDLLPHLEGVDRLLVIDAVETGAAAGTIVRLNGEDIPLALATKVSPHQMGLKDLLLVADLQGYSPPLMVLWGVQPESIEMDIEMSPAVAEAVPVLELKVLEELAGWGIHAERIPLTPVA